MIRGVELLRQNERNTSVRANICLMCVLKIIRREERRENSRKNYAKNYEQKFPDMVMCIISAKTSMGEYYG